MTALAKTQDALVVSDDEQKDILRKSICPDLSNAELEHFAMVCNRTGLDPFARQIYAFKQGGRVMHITSIDGFRLKAERTGKRDGMEGPFWCGDDGEWKDVWLSDKPPKAARVSVYVKGQRMPYTATALWSFYGKNTPVWRSGGPHMLAKCAESLAYRMAFPEDLGGLYTKEEMDQMHTAPSERPVEPKGQAAQLAAARRGAPAEQVPRDFDDHPGDESSVGPDPDFDPDTGEVLDAEFYEEEQAGEEPVPQGEAPALHFGKAEGKRIDTLGPKQWNWIANQYRGKGEKADELRKWARFLLKMHESVQGEG